MTTTQTMFICAILAGTIGASCKGDKVEESPAVKAVPEETSGVAKTLESTTTKDHMQDHFGRAASMRDAVIAGDIDSARQHAEWLAGHETHENLRAWEVQVDRMRAAAKPDQALVDLGTMARATARVAAACGSCHVESKSIPTFPVVDKPGEASGAPERMLLHDWAADRMWEGLTAPSDDLWNQGVAALAIAPLTDEEILANASAARELVEQAQAVHDLGNQGSNATTPAARAEVYARFLENCATCHQRVGVE